MSSDFKVGDRVRLKEDYDGGGYGFIPKGSTGTIVFSGAAWQNMRDGEVLVDVKFDKVAGSRVGVFTRRLESDGPPMKVGDLVRCITDTLSPCIGEDSAPKKGEVYRVAAVGGQHSNWYITPEGFGDGWLSMHFERVEKTPLRHDINWESRYREEHRHHVWAKEKLADIEQRLRPLVDKEYRPDSPRPSTAALVGVLVEEHAKYVRAKRQLDLAESYNFKRSGLTDRDAKLDLYDYVLLALGKPKAERKSATIEALEDISVYLTKTLESDLVKQSEAYILNSPPLFDLGYVTRKWWPRYSARISNIDCPDKLEPAPKAGCTGCAEGCSHPDHKKA